MKVEWLRRYCLSLPHVTEAVQWEDHLVFKLADKSFAITTLSGEGNFCSFKASPEDFAELIERPGVIPAPYLARAKWVALEREDSLPPTETKKYLERAHRLVFEKLPKKTRLAMAG